MTASCENGKKWIQSPNSILNSSHIHHVSEQLKLFAGIAFHVDAILRYNHASNSLNMIHSKWDLCRNENKTIKPRNITANFHFIDRIS